MKMLSVGCSRFAVVWGHEEAAGVFRRLGCLNGQGLSEGGVEFGGLHGGEDVGVAVEGARGFANVGDGVVAMGAGEAFEFEIVPVKHFTDGGLGDFEEFLVGFHGLSLAWVCWIAGAVEPTARDAMGRPQTALEQGWVIRYVEYESTAADALPVQIELTRDDIDVRIRIDQWQLQTP